MLEDALHQQIERMQDEELHLEGNGTRPSHRGGGFMEGGKSFTLNTTEVHAICYEVIPIDRAAFNQGENAKYEMQIGGGTAHTIIARGPGAVCYKKP